MMLGVDPEEGGSLSPEGLAFLVIVGTVIFLILLCTFCKNIHWWPCYDCWEECMNRCIVCCERCKGKTRHGYGPIETGRTSAMTYV